MNTILGNISIAIGGILFVIVLVIGFARGVPILVAVFRASIVMCISSAVVAVFFRFFSSVLYKFVAEKVQENKRVKEAAEREKESSENKSAESGGGGE